MTVIYSPLHGFIWNQHNDQFPVGLLAQLVERCTGIAEVMGSNPVQPWFSLLLKSRSLLRRSFSYSRLHPQYKYMTFIYSQSFILNFVYNTIPQRCKYPRQETQYIRLTDLFTLRVQCRGSLVKKQNLRITNQCPGNSYPLFLPSWDESPLVSYQSVITLHAEKHSYAEIRAVASMRQDEALPKIDFSEEKCHGKCLKEHFWASRFKKFLGGHAPRPP